MSKKGYFMIKKCDVSLKSVVDGKENKFLSVGQLETFINKIKLYYQENSATICLTFQGVNVWVERKGDYALRLPLIEGQTSQGEIEFNGNVGHLEIHTHKVELSYLKNKLSAHLRYDLLFGDGAQEMELYIRAIVKGEMEDKLYEN